ncbi:MarC family protein [Geomonas sp. Red32]|uniref:MarC family protein n=1 Tax=Geomonas sp. Red32 TaxID=2912856 RepID=UPI00202CBE33|nr:MarC family protein [Geomonas sp. Red32]MCM0080269.1 MarC family protein [Geomonas sp. Red32]
MNAYFNFFISIWIKFFFLLTPFFVLSVFLSMTQEMGGRERRKLAVRVTLAVLLACFTLYFFGNHLFSLFGITLDSFRIGAGVLLFLSAVQMVQGEAVAPGERQDDISVVPLAIPITVGPATTGALMVMGADLQENWQVIAGCAALAAAVVCIGVILFCASAIEHVIGRKGITILSKLTGLMLAAIAAQLVFSGIKNFLHIV